MKAETKYIKEYLQGLFPESKLSLKYIKATNYAFSSDRIQIKTDIPFEKVRKCLLEITKGILIFRKGSVVSSHAGRNNYIGDFKDNLVEFIEVEEIQTERGNIFTILETVSKIVQLPHDAKRKKHTFYQVAGKVGTHPTTLIWFVDKLPEVGRGCIFLYEDQQGFISPASKNFNICGNFPSLVHYGICDKINEDGYPFVRR